MVPYPKKQPRRPKPPDGSFSNGIALSIVERDQWKCAWCGTELVGDRGPHPWQWQIHHRWPRATGGTSESHVGRASNGVALHGSCHAYLEANRAEAEEAGFIVRHGRELPRMVPIRHKVLGLVRLRDDGTYDREQWS